MSEPYDSDAAVEAAPSARLEAAVPAAGPRSWRGLYLWDEVAGTLARIDLLDKRMSRLAFHYVDPTTLAPTGRQGFMDCLEAMARCDYGVLAIYPPEHPFIVQRLPALRERPANACRRWRARLPRTAGVKP